MARTVSKKTKRPSAPPAPKHESFREMLQSANRRAHDQANRKTGLRELKSVHAAIAESAPDDSVDPVDLLQTLSRFVIGLLLLPVCWITTWTLLSRFSHATLEQGFWQSTSFWYFTIGCLSMIGWFWSGVFKSFFLYLYVLGHELTHAAFVILFRGRVTSLHVSLEGGYITTNKTNLIIALSPYFVPFWSIIVAIGYCIARFGFHTSTTWDLAFYALMGVTWTFHLVWTLWMIPRDQPDLRQNGTFLSLVVIYLANLLVLAALLCLADGSPADNASAFAREWLRHAVTCADTTWQWLDNHFSGFIRRILLQPNGL